MTEAVDPAGGRDVAVIGLGQMGRGIARNLDRAGRLAAAWDSSPQAMRNAGLSPAVTLAEPGTRADLKAVLLVVPGSEEVRAVLGDGGLLRAPHQGQVLLDLTTSSPAATRAIAAEAKATGRAYLDCGMTGGAKAADGGTITLMVGGDGAVVDASRPLLRHFAGQVFHVGDTGAGHAMKLIHNMICHTIFLATSEGCRLAEQLGIPLKTAVAVLNAGNARSFVSEQRFPSHVIPGTFDGRSRAANLAKDLALAADMAREAGQPDAYAALAARLLARAMQLGLGEQDFTRLYEHLPQLMTADGEAPQVQARQTLP
jgi:3-hydroxyisobutyrate dehydrogenase